MKPLIRNTRTRENVLTLLWKIKHFCCSICFQCICSPAPWGTLHMYDLVKLNFELNLWIVTGGNRASCTRTPPITSFFFSVNNWSAEAKEGCIKAMIPALRGWIGALRWPLCSPGNVGRDNHWSKRKQLGLRRMNIVKDKNWSKCQINWGNKNNQSKTGVLNGLLQFQFSLIVKNAAKKKP